MILSKGSQPEQGCRPSIEIHSAFGCKPPAETRRGICASLVIIVARVQGLAGWSGSVTMPCRIGMPVVLKACAGSMAIRRFTVSFGRAT